MLSRKTGMWLCLTISVKKNKRECMRQLDMYGEVQGEKREKDI
jgi:hypothetical protein